jgi:hypothetical protein
MGGKGTGERRKRVVQKERERDVAVNMKGDKVS